MYLEHIKHWKQHGNSVPNYLYQALVFFWLKWLFFAAALVFAFINISWSFAFVVGAFISDFWEETACLRYKLDNITMQLFALEKNLRQIAKQNNPKE